MSRGLPARGQVLLPSAPHSPGWRRLCPCETPRGDNPAPCRCLSHPAVPRAWSPARSVHWVPAQHCWGRTGEWQGGAGLPGPRGGHLALKPPLRLLPTPGGVNRARFPRGSARPPAPLWRRRGPLPLLAAPVTAGGGAIAVALQTPTWSPAAQVVPISQVKNQAWRFQDTQQRGSGIRTVSPTYVCAPRFHSPKRLWPPSCQMLPSPRPLPPLETALSHKPWQAMNSAWA